MNLKKWEHKHKVLAILIIISVFILGFVASWGITVGMVWLITCCFGWKYNLLTATGVWLIICCVWWIIKGATKK